MNFEELCKLKEYGQINIDLLSNDVALFKNNYVMGFSQKQRKIGLAASVSLLSAAFLLRGQVVPGLKAGFIGFWGMGYIVCPEIYNWILFK